MDNSRNMPPQGVDVNMVMCECEEHITTHSDIASEDEYINCQYGNDLLFKDEESLNEIVVGAYKYVDAKLDYILLKRERLDSKYEVPVMCYPEFAIEYRGFRAEWEFQSAYVGVSEKYDNDEIRRNLCKMIAGHMLDILIDKIMNV